MADKDLASQDLWSTLHLVLGRLARAWQLKEVSPTAALTMGSGRLQISRVFPRARCKLRDVSVVLVDPTIPILSVPIPLVVAPMFANESWGPRVQIAFEVPVRTKSQRQGKFVYIPLLGVG